MRPSLVLFIVTLLLASLPLSRAADTTTNSTSVSGRMFTYVIVHGSVSSAGKTTYILTMDPGQEPQRDMFFKSSERAKARHWTTIIMEGDHNVQWTKPKELVELLEKAP